MSAGLATDVGGRKRAPLTLEQAVYLYPVALAVSEVLATGAPTDCPPRFFPGDERAKLVWLNAPAQMTRLHSALPLAEDRTFSLLELIDFYVSEGAARA